MSALDLTAALDALVDERVDERVGQRVAELLAFTNAPEPWLDVDGAAAHLGYANGDLARGHRRVYDLVARRELHPARDGRRLLFKASQLDRYLEATK